MNCCITCNMLIPLPEHSHCEFCGDPVAFEKKYCDENCELKHKEELKKEKIKDWALNIFVGIVLVALVFGSILK